MMIGFAAVRWADAFPPSVATSRAAATAASPAATTVILDRLIESPSWLHALRRPFSHGPLRIRGLSGFHEAVEDRLKRHLDAVPPRFPKQRPVDQLDLGRPPRLDVLQHRRVVPASAPRQIGRASCRERVET